MEQTDYRTTGPIRMIFNYNDIFFSFFYDDEAACIHRSREYAMNYVYSGEMVLDNGKEQIHVGKGECVFIPRDHHITLYKKTCNGERYCGIFLNFTRQFLREMFGQFGKQPVSLSTPEFATGGAVKLPRTAEIASLFASMTPYFDSGIQPSEELLQLKMVEGMYVLLNTNKNLYASVFDFTDPWKIDILNFLENNYMNDISIEEIANYTGRSLSTFKRDFKKCSTLSPREWLIHRRLEAAHELIQKGERKVSEICFDVGFKNLSHFSKIYKEKYGTPPTRNLQHGMGVEF